MSTALFVLAVVTLAAFLGFHFWFGWSERRRAERKFRWLYEDELPPVESLAGESLEFVVVAMTYYRNPRRREPCPHRYAHVVWEYSAAGDTAKGTVRCVGCRVEVPEVKVTELVGGFQ